MQREDKLFIFINKKRFLRSITKFKVSPMRKFLLFLICLTSLQITAQEEKLSLKFLVGTPIEIPVGGVKEISFYEADTTLDIIGEWLNVDEESATIESFDFHLDGLFDYYVILPTGDMSAVGNYEFSNDVLSFTLAGSSFANPVVGFSGTNFTIYSAGSSSVYYKVQNTYDIATTDEPISIGNEGDRIIYVDNTFVGVVDNKVKALKSGTGYALVKDAKRDAIVAYKISVRYMPGVTVDWTKYFKKSVDEINAEFGTPDKIETSNGIITYTYQGNYNAEIGMLFISFDESTQKVCQIMAVCNGYDGFNTYYSDIKNKYIEIADMGNASQKYYSDTGDLVNASVVVSVASVSGTYYVIYSDYSR